MARPSSIGELGNKGTTVTRVSVSLMDRAKRLAEAENHSTITQTVSTLLDEALKTKGF